MRLPPLCRHFRGELLFGLILCVGVLLEPRGADLGSLLGVCLGSWGGGLLVCGSFCLLGARGADLGSLLGVSLGSWGGSLPAATKRLKSRTHLERFARFAQKVSPVCARCPS